MKLHLIFVFLIGMLFLGGCGGSSDTIAAPTPEWNSAELNRIANLWIGSLRRPRPDPSNAYADNPAAAAWGQQLFFDQRLSQNGAVSCATCHRPEMFFTDGLPLAQGIGTGTRHTPTTVGATYYDWQFWDGRKDTLWSQALSPLETAHEQGLTRMETAHFVANQYQMEYEAIFGPLPDLTDRRRFPLRAGPLGDAEARAAWQAMDPADQLLVNEVFANVGKALAAYQRLLLPGPSRFDAYAEALLSGDRSSAVDILTPDELAGLQLFIGDGLCTNCHSGPMLADQFFHNIGVPDSTPDLGRETGAPMAVADPFNCLGSFSDASPAQCRALNEVRVEGAGLSGAFKTPTMRNVAGTGPYMHNGHLATLSEVLTHYNEAPPAAIGRSELIPLNLSDAQLRQLEAFLGTLSGPLATPPQWLAPPEK